MSKITDADRFALLEKRVSELGTLLHFVDSMRVKIEKSIGVIDQQLIKTDAGLTMVRRQLAGSAKTKTAKPIKSKPKPMPKIKAKAKAKTKPKGKAASRKR